MSGKKLDFPHEGHHRRAYQLPETSCRVDASSLPVVPGCSGALWKLRNFIPICFLSCMLRFRSSDKVIPLRKILYDRLPTT